VTPNPLDLNTEHLLRNLAPQVLGVLLHRFRDFSAVEDAVQESLIAAANQWPQEGTPDSPLAWLIRVATRRMTDHARSEHAHGSGWTDPLNAKYWRVRRGTELGS